MGVLLSTIYFSAMNSVFSTLHAEPGLRFYEDDKNTLLEVRAPNKSGLERMAMREFMASKCPSLTKKFTPAWWLFKYVHRLLVARKAFLMDPVVIFRRSTVWQVTFRRLIRLCTTGASPLVHPTHQFDHSLFSRKYLQLKDGGTMSVTFSLSQSRSITFYLSGLDFVPSTRDHRSFKEDAPVIVVMHGLTGGQYRLI
jgi:predicted alpha/beta-fold hydrolase